MLIQHLSSEEHSIVRQCPHTAKSRYSSRSRTVAQTANIISCQIKWNWAQMLTVLKKARYWSH